MGLIKVLYYIDKYRKHQFDIPVEEQLLFMSSLGQPKDDIDRSYKQFRCQELFSPWWIRAFWFLISIFTIPVMLCFLLWKGYKVRFVIKVGTIAEDKGMNEIIPQELSLKYEIHHKEWNSGYLLIKSDLFYIFTKLIGKYQPFFIFKAIMQIAAYSARITKYQPIRIIVHEEFSFCSSLLTDYCHYRGVEHINVQHGEKLMYIRDAFFHFDECYVWNEHYENIFKEMHAESTQFRIAIPPSLHIDCANHQKISAYADYKYYLAADTEADIKNIVASMAFAKREGKTVRYRIHPRYTDLSVLRKYVSDEEIEYPKKVSILESISNMEYAVGSYTTVLLQAYLSGKKVLLDDVTYKKRFEQLKEYRYILAKDDIEKLSEKQI